MAQKCSIVIPAYNAGGFIIRTIDSVLAQTCPDYDLIVVDDGSTDNTAEVLTGYGSKLRYIYQENAGGGAARNTGIAAAKYDWIALLDHDDEWLPDKLQAQMDLLERNPNLRWCGANYCKVFMGRQAVVGNVESLRKTLDNRDYFENFLTTSVKLSFSLAPSTVIIHKEIFEEVGGFGQLHLADIDMWLRIAYRFPKIGYLPQPLAFLHLDNLDPDLMRQRFAAKRGAQVQELITRHLQLAKEQQCLAKLRPLAGKFLRQSLITAIYHGFRADARTTVEKFRGFFPWYWRFATYLLTVFPKVTSTIARAVAYLAYKLRLERQVTRRWIYSEEVEKAD